VNASGKFFDKRSICASSPFCSEEYLANFSVGFEATPSTYSVVDKFWDPASPIPLMLKGLFPGGLLLKPFSRRLWATR